MSAKFIVIEGLDGSGKSTHIRMLSSRLRAMGRQTFETAEPTASATGGLVRDALSGLTPRTGDEIAALFLADRIAHNVHPVNGIEAMLKAGRDVISDRYYYSSLAYQGRLTDPDWVAKINIDCPAIRKPDICIFLDLDNDACCRRMERGRAYREIYENSKALMETRAQYFAVFDRLKERDNIHIISSGRPTQEVAEDVFRAVSEILD